MSGMGALFGYSPDAGDLARTAFPRDLRGRHFGNAARRLARMSGLPYEEALDALHRAALRAAYDVFEEKEER